jgi:hypothetical protein
MNRIVFSLLRRLPPRAHRPALITISVLAGVFAGVLLHFLCYRLELPSRPFIYVSF